MIGVSARTRARTHLNAEEHERKQQHAVQVVVVFVGDVKHLVRVGGEETQCLLVDESCRQTDRQGGRQAGRQREPQYSSSHGVGSSGTSIHSIAGVRIIVGGAAAKSPAAATGSAAWARHVRRAD
jgi:hypothetical protein